jgi:hypothetical protein
MSEKEIPELEETGQDEEFGELIKYTGGGFIGGLLTGALLDHFGFQGSAMGQWIVRTLSGEGARDGACNFVISAIVRSEMMILNN